MPKSTDKLTLTVLVPSYRRPVSLLRCLEGLRSQTRLPDEIVVVLRDVDEESQQQLKQWVQHNQPVCRVEMAIVTKPGQIVAMNRGLEVAQGDVVCFTDDDCVPRKDWLESLAAHYSQEDVGGVGGRDVVHHGDEIESSRAKTVGKITWWGRIIGNHHCEFDGGPVQVDHLKGANMSFRRDLMARFDETLARGSSALNDTDMSLWVRGQGAKLIYDPQSIVDHYPATRFDEASRELDKPDVVYDDSYNWVYCMLKYMPPLQCICFLAYALGVGIGTRYGLLKYLAAVPKRPMGATRQFVAATGGKMAAIRTHLARQTEK